jgi:hypothetical protein
MRNLKFAAGVWFLGATGDRFVKSGYRADRTMEERFRLAASIEGISGLEMHCALSSNISRGRKAARLSL